MIAASPSADARRTPPRLVLAHAAARVLPPVMAHLVTDRIYPLGRGREDAFPFQVRALTGSPFRGATDELHACYFAVHGHYDWRLWVCARTLCAPGDTLVEVGANVGTETVGFADIVSPGGRVVAFEPFPANLRQLERNLAASDQRDAVHVVPLAVCDAAGTMEFVPPPGINNGVGHLGTAGASEPAIRVGTTTLDGWFADGAPVRMLVMDVEGAEPAVLRGGRAWIRRARPAIALEANEHHLRRAGSSRAELQALLGELGYRAWFIARHRLRPARVDDDAPGGNWLALPEEDEHLARRVSRAITLCGALPPWRWLNPLARGGRAVA